VNVFDKDNNFITKLSLDVGLQLKVCDILEINNNTYIVESIILNNVNSQHIVYVDTLLNHKLKHHILTFTYDYYTPEEIQHHLDKIGLEIKLKDDIEENSIKKII